MKVLARNKDTISFWIEDMLRVGKFYAFILSKDKSSETVGLVDVSVHMQTEKEEHVEVCNLTQTGYCKMTDVTDWVVENIGALSHPFDSLDNADFFANLVVTLTIYKIKYHDMRYIELLKEIREWAKGE